MSTCTGCQHTWPSTPKYEGLQKLSYLVQLTMYDDMSVYMALSQNEGSRKFLIWIKLTMCVDVSVYIDYSCLGSVSHKHLFRNKPYITGVMVRGGWVGH